MKYFIFCLILSCFFLSCKEDAKEEKTDNTNTTSTRNRTMYDSIKKGGITIYTETNEQFPQGRILYALHTKTGIQVSSSNPFQPIKEGSKILIVFGGTELDVMISSIHKGKVCIKNKKIKKAVEECLPFLKETEKKLKPIL